MRIGGFFGVGEMVHRQNIRVESDGDPSIVAKLAFRVARLLRKIWHSKWGDIMRGLWMLALADVRRDRP